MIRLSERLQKIADFVKKDEGVADIGTDHGYLPIYLIQNNKSDKVIVSDINEGPIETARKNFNRYIPQHKIDTRIGNGIEILQEYEVEVIVIAGMGGLLIRDILNKNLYKSKSYKKIILQPRNAQDKLRKWLIENGFQIKDESLAREGKYLCEIILAHPGKSKPYEKEIYYEVGYKLIENKDPLLKEFIRNKIRIEETIIKNTQAQKTEKAQNQQIRSIKRIEQLKEVYENVDTF